jgi:hypothetical protein
MKDGVSDIYHGLVVVCHCTNAPLQDMSVLSAPCKDQIDRAAELLGGRAPRGECAAPLAPQPPHV